MDRFYIIKDAELGIYLKPGLTLKDGLKKSWNLQGNLDTEKGYLIFAGNAEQLITWMKTARKQDRILQSSTWNILEIDLCNKTVKVIRRFNKIKSEE